MMLRVVRPVHQPMPMVAEANVVALQTLRLHQQVDRARVQRMLMAVQVSDQHQCSVICLVDLQQVMPRAQQHKVVRGLQVVDRDRPVARLR